jgi:Mor family transcriptional regulator
MNGPLRAVKGTEERNESHVDLTRQYGMSAVTMNKVIHRVYLTWKHPRR